MANEEKDLNGEVSSVSDINSSSEQPAFVNIDNGVNKDLGKFTNVVQEEDQLKGLNLTKEEEKKIQKLKEQKIDINFEKFETQTVYGKTFSGKIKNWFQVKLDQGKAAKWIWLTYMLAILLIIGGSICFIYFDHYWLHHDKHYTYKNWPNDWRNARAGYWFSYFALFTPVIPFLVLVIGWLIQINGITKSPTFHMAFVIILLISFLFLFISLIESSIYIGECVYANHLLD